MKRFITNLSVMVTLFAVISLVAGAQTLKGTKIEYTEEDKAQIDKKKEEAKNKFNQQIQNSKEDKMEIQKQREQQRMEQIKRVPI